jgi:hypothetical protein
MIVPLFNEDTRGCGWNLETGEGVVVEREQAIIRNSTDAGRWLTTTS